MKKIISISICLLLLLSCIGQQAPKEETIEPSQLKEDLNFLVSSIGEIHPSSLSQHIKGEVL